MLFISIHSLFLKQFSFHQTKIEYVESAVTAKVGIPPVFKFDIRRSKQPFLKQHNVCDTEFTVRIDITYDRIKSKKIRTELVLIRIQLRQPS